MCFVIAIAVCSKAAVFVDQALAVDVVRGSGGIALVDYAVVTVWAHPKYQTLPRIP